MKKIQYWSYINSGGRMYATEEAIKAYREQSLETYNKFLRGDFEFADVLPNELLIELELLRRNE